MAPPVPAPTGVRRATAALDERTLAVVVAMVALGLRLAYALSRRQDEVAGDAYYFHNQANLVASGHGYTNPLLRAVDGVDVAAADHPPLYTTYLSVWSFFGARSSLWHLIASAVLGTATVLLVMAAGRRLAGPRVGLLAGLAAALHPNLWVWDGMLLSETATGCAVALVLWCAIRALEDPSPGWLAATGAAIGLAALARSEMVLLVLMLIPLAARRRPSAGSPGPMVAGLVGAAALIGVLVPWAAYNQTRFTHPVPLSTGAGLVLASSNCESTYSGPLIGYWDFNCSLSGEVRVGVESDTEPSEADRALREDAVEFARSNTGRLPAVAAARLGRVTGVFRPVQQAGLADFREGVPNEIALSSLGTWYLLAAFAVVGARELHRRGVPLSPLLAPLAVVLVVAVLVYGIWRFRVPGDVSVCLLAAVGADALIRRHLEGGVALRSTDGLAGRSGEAERPAEGADDAPSRPAARRPSPVSPRPGP
ncbi:MAG: ArnT family glycosyltransferase [Iamia sp.]